MIVENVLRNKLHDELIKGGIVPISVVAINDDSMFGADIQFAEGTDMVLVQQIIDTHDPMPTPKPPTIEERLEALELALLDLL